MLKNSLLVLILLFPALSGVGQESEYKPSVIGLTMISQVNQGNSYITFPTDIGNIEPLMFEGNLIPNFYLRQDKDSRLMGVLTPQIIIRMYQERSFPVRTPSYMPQITLYYLLNGKNNVNKLSLYGKIAHHSNGQDGEFYLENGEINTTSGDFATNYLEPGLILTNVNKRLKAYQFFKTSIEIHPTGWIQEELKGIYSQYRWHNAFSIFKLPIRNAGLTVLNPNISLKGEATWMFGNVKNPDETRFNRLNLSMTFYYHIKFMEDIGLFIQFYHGSDYYNIYFSHRLDMLRFGIMTEKLRF